MAWDNTAPANTSTPAVEAAKIRANWSAIEDGNATGGVPQKGSWVETFGVGKDADNDIKFEANNGDTSNPFIMYDASANEWVVSHNGTDTTALGAVPSSAVILYIGTSCPSGYTDITATYEDRYIMADSLATAAITTGGAAAHTHSIPSLDLTTYSASFAADTNHYTVTTGDKLCYGSSGSGTGVYDYTTASTSGAASAEPKYAGMRLCQKD